ncbi:alpha/beta fold hydrolase [Microtetraspora fusca]|uniref:Alpha/beta fold hydrolase n=1 Tax=Microtetraspora fusca TaxID=1997 RepID=A0ABW6VJT1_MICFU
MKLPGEAGEHLAARAALLDGTYREVAARLPTNTQIRFDDDGRLHLAALKPEAEPASLVRLRVAVRAMLPAVDLPEVLLEVFSWTGADRAFTSIAGGEARLADLHVTIAALRAQPAVDPGRVFVVGHSMGGKVAPRVAAAEPSVAGLVILAGDAEPMHRAAVRVARHLASLDPGAGEVAKLIARQAAVVDSPDLSPSTPAAELPFGLPGSYWLDLRGYDPVAAAAALDRPMLILQGGRDYQVTVEDDLARWRAGLAHRPDVTIRVYDADDHLFFPGAGPSTPAEYEVAQHVDAAVVADVAGWLAPRGRSGGGGGPGCP